jgi:hypothetical protein
MVGFWSYQETIIWDNNSAYAYVRCDNLRQIKLIEMVNQLSVPARQIILLYTFENMRKDAIASELGKTTAQIRETMSKANHVMRQFVTQYDSPAIYKLSLNKLFKQWPYQAYAELLNLKTNAVIVR